MNASVQGEADAPPLPFFRKEVTMEYEEAKKLIVDELTKKLKTKSKFYFNDLSKILDMKPREAKKIINKLVQEECPGILVFGKHLHVRDARHRQTGWRRARRLNLSLRRQAAPMGIAPPCTRF